MFCFVVIDLQLCLLALFPLKFACLRGRGDGHLWGFVHLTCNSKAIILIMSGFGCLALIVFGLPECSGSGGYPLFLPLACSHGWVRDSSTRVSKGLILALSYWAIHQHWGIYRGHWSKSGASENRTRRSSNVSPVGLAFARRRQRGSA